MIDPFAPAERAHLKALWEAYFSATGLLPLTASHRRLMDLKELDRRGVKPEDVRGVIAGLKRAISNGTKGYTEASLDWRNTLGAVDKFEELVNRYRQAVQRRRGATREAAEAVPRPIERKLADGSTLSVLDSQPSSSFVPPIKGTLARLVNETIKKEREE
jgi:hypothetical protein